MLSVDNIRRVYRLHEQFTKKLKLVLHVFTFTTPDDKKYYH